MRISKNLSGNKIGWIAREKRGGKWVVVARAETEEKLEAALRRAAGEEPAPKKKSSSKKSSSKKSK